MTDRSTLALASVVGALIASLITDSADWELPTPCEDWNLGQLVDHVIGGNWFTVGILSGETAQSALDDAMASFGNHYDRSSAVASSFADQLAAFSEPGALDQTVEHVTQSMPGRRALTLRLHDLTMHAWDIGETVEPGFGIPDELVAWALADLAANDPETVATFELLPARPDADEWPRQEQLLARFGRTSTQSS